MTCYAADAVEMSVTTTNSLSQDYTNVDDHILETLIIHFIDTLGNFTYL